MTGVWIFFFSFWTLGFWFSANFFLMLCICAQSLQWCPTLCSQRDCSPPGSSIYGILHARMLEWVALPSSRVSFWLEPGIKLTSPLSPALQADSLLVSHWGSFSALYTQGLIKPCLMAICNIMFGEMWILSCKDLKTLTALPIRGKSYPALYLGKVSLGVLHVETTC